MAVICSLKRGDYYHVMEQTQSAYLLAVPAWHEPQKLVLLSDHSPQYKFNLSIEEVMASSYLYIICEQYVGRCQVCHQVPSWHVLGLLILF